VDVLEDRTPVVYASLDMMPAGDDRGGDGGPDEGAGSRRRGLTRARSLLFSRLAL
jgi:hypothetical protein